LNRSRRAASLFVPAVAALAALFAPSASAAKVVAIDGAPAPGPKSFDLVHVEKYGPKSADTVLVLIPGTGGGAGSVAPVAKEIAGGVDGVQVWGFERREQAFEDTSGFSSGNPATAEDYYLGFNYDRVSGDDVPFVADWGFATEMNDLHQVIAAASKGGRSVILGGHSRGASSAVAYAAWDFKGDGPGFEDLDGLVLIDGGLGAFGPEEFSRSEAKERLAEIRDGDIFSDPLGAGIPEIGPIFAQLAALYARKLPDAKSALQDNPIVAAAGLAPPYDVTNEGFLGYIFDKTYSPLGASLQIRAGDFGPGSPRPWASGENTPIEDFAAAFGRYKKGNALEWYYPNRMVLDTAAANALGRTPAAKYLDLRLFHTRQVDLPLYAFQTELTDGGVLKGARTLVKKSRITKTKFVDASDSTSHLDPVLAPAETNRFEQTVEPFLKRIARRAGR
jgi:pimeloyl-ACP methyl ester carboxylesterase